MTHQKILNLLNKLSHSKFVTVKWSNVNDQSNASYSMANEIIYNTEVLKCNLYDYNHAYILVRDNITTYRRALPIQVAFKNCSLFHSNWWNNNRWCWRLRFGYTDA